MRLENTVLPIALLSAAFLFSFEVLASRPLAKCANRPEFILSHRSPIAFKNLPPKIFIAQVANFYVENKSQTFQLWSEQSFLKGSSQFICGKYDNGKSESFSLYAPTLMDLSGEQKLSDSYWQFRMIANTKQFGIWNQKTRIFTRSKDLESAIAALGAQVQFFQISEDIYEMLITRETESYNETLSIRFDTVSDLR
jgi:hypothetical protein